MDAAFLPCELVAVAAHPDDAELGCGATLAAFCRSGKAVIVDLSAGEKASRGHLQTREQEARAAAMALGVRRLTLGLPDTGLDGSDEHQRLALVAALRQLRPRFLLIPDENDPHPDHRQAHALCLAASFLAGVAPFGGGLPHRPELVLCYPGPRQLFSPHLVVDVTEAYERKRQALASYRSQFVPGEGPATHLASGYFIAAVEARDRAFGNLVGVELGEGYRLAGTASAKALAGFCQGLA